jgi:hypothetical protein
MGVNMMGISKRRFVILLFVLAFFLSYSHGFLESEALAEHSTGDAENLLKLAKALFMSVERFEPIPFFKRYEIRIHDGVRSIGDTKVSVTKGAVVAPAFDESSSYVGSTGRITSVNCVAIRGTMIVPTAKAPPMLDIITAENIGGINRLLESKPVSFLRKRRLVLTDTVRTDIVMALDINYHYIVSMSVTEEEAFIRMNDVIMGILRIKEPDMPKY